MTKLAAITHKIRSKNAGPFWITIDIFCSDDADYRRALGAVKNEQVAHALGISVTDLKRYNLTNLYRSMFAYELEKRIDNEVSVAIAHPGITKSRQSRPYEVTSIRKSAFTYISTNIATGTEPVLKAIQTKDISAQKTFAPKYFGIYGKPGTMRLNRLVYNDDLRKKLWDHTAEELDLYL